jgi:hypothetical protein
LVDKANETFTGVASRLQDTGAKNGKYYAVNFPLHSGMDDESYESIFKPVIQKVMETFCPSAVVLQCGADSLTGDRLGCFNVTTRGHGECVRFVKGFGLPMLVVGGGGYRIRNVSRAWAYETSILVNQEVSNNIPYNDYFEFYTPDFKLHLVADKDLKNDNTKEYLEKHKYVRRRGQAVTRAEANWLVCCCFVGSRSSRTYAALRELPACRCSRRRPLGCCEKKTKTRSTQIVARKATASTSMRPSSTTTSRTKITARRTRRMKMARRRTSSPWTWITKRTRLL